MTKKVLIKDGMFIDEGSELIQNAKALVYSFLEKEGGQRPSDEGCKDFVLKKKSAENESLENLIISLERCSVNEVLFNNRQCKKSDVVSMLKKITCDWYDIKELKKLIKDSLQEKDSDKDSAVRDKIVKKVAGKKTHQEIFNYLSNLCVNGVDGEMAIGENIEKKIASVLLSLFDCFHHKRMRNVVVKSEKGAMFSGLFKARREEMYNPSAKSSCGVSQKIIRFFDGLVE